MSYVGVGVNPNWDIVPNFLAFLSDASPKLKHHMNLKLYCGQIAVVYFIYALFNRLLGSNKCLLIKLISLAQMPVGLPESW